MGINIFGLVLIVLGGILVFLGVTGRYQVFTGVAAATGQNTSSEAQQSFTAGFNAALQQILAQGG